MLNNRLPYELNIEIMNLVGVRERVNLSQVSKLVRSFVLPKLQNDKIRFVRRLIGRKALELLHPPHVMKFGGVAVMKANWRAVAEIGRVYENEVKHILPDLYDHFGGIGPRDNVKHLFLEIAFMPGGGLKEALTDMIYEHRRVISPCNWVTIWPEENEELEWLLPLFPELVIDAVTKYVTKALPANQLHPMQVKVLHKYPQLRFLCTDIKLALSQLNPVHEFLHYRIRSVWETLIELGYLPLGSLPELQP